MALSFLLMSHFFLLQCEDDAADDPIGEHVLDGLVHFLQGPTCDMATNQPTSSKVHRLSHILSRADDGAAQRDAINHNLGDVESDFISWHRHTDYKSLAATAIQTKRIRGGMSGNHNHSMSSASSELLDLRATMSF